MKIAAELSKMLPGGKIEKELYFSEILDLTKNELKKAVCHVVLLNIEALKLTDIFFNIEIQQTNFIKEKIAESFIKILYLTKQNEVYQKLVKIRFEEVNEIPLSYNFKPIEIFLTHTNKKVRELVRNLRNLK